MSNQLQITGGAKVRNLNGVITGTTGVLGSVPLGAANGVATLDSSGKVPVSQLPASVVTYLGTWNAATNTPTLVNGTGDPGDLYICNVAGTVNFGAGPISFVVGDWVLYGSGTWQKSSGQNGTVTSVAVTETGDALTITGSPITTAGTINIGFAGTSAQYVAGNGSLITFPSLTGYVPYTGATGAVNLGAYDLTVQGLTIGKGASSLANNTALGYGTLFHINTGNYNTAVGYESLHNTTTGQYNTALGQSSLFTNTTGSQNTALGLNALLYNTTGGSNVVVGVDALQHNTTGSSNTVLGYNAGSHITGGSTPNTTASNSVYIGRDSKAKLDGGTNEIVIGYNAIGNGSNTATFGNTSTTANYFTGSINAGSFIKSGGTSSQYLMADGSVSTGPDLTGYVTLATTQTITGTKTFNATTTASKIRIDNTLLSEGTTVAFKQYESGALGETGYTSLAAQGSNLFYINWGGTKAAILDSVNLSTFRTYTLPNADGTLALTSQLTSGTVTSVGLSSATSGVTIGSTPITTSGTITLAIATASGSQQGLLSSTDWTTFNGKQAALSGTGFVKISGSTISYDNSTYLTTLSAASTYVPYTGATGSINIGSNNLTTSNTIFSNSVWCNQMGGGDVAVGATTFSMLGSDIIFATGTAGSSSWTEKMRLKADGNFGIGNAAPSFKLDVTGTGRFTGNLTLSGTYADLQNTTYIRFSNTGGGTRWGYIQHDGTNMAFVNDISGGNFNFNKNVGIGTTSPSNPLTISSTITYGAEIYRSNAADSRINLTNTTTTSGGDKGLMLGEIGVDSYFYNYANGAAIFGTNATERMRITSTGALKLSDGTLSGGGGFEMTSEAFFGARFQSGGYKFMAANNSTEYLRITSALGTGIVYSNGGALTSTNPSDSRLKENITDITYGLSDILKLRPVSYYWKDDKINQGVQFGFIAQEVKEVMPEAIKEFGEDVKFLGLEKDAIYATLVKAIQELKAEIDELKNK
jgi:hypothetical protein